MGQIKKSVINKSKIFVVFHNKLVTEYYDRELLGEYLFINVSLSNRSEYPSGFKVINQYDFDKFKPIGKIYTESEVLYNVFKNPYLTADLDYVGFLQYDIDSSNISAPLLSEWESHYEHINFQPYKFDVDYNQKILMDKTQPYKRKGSGVNCYNVILEDYNEFYGTKFTLDDLRGKTINLCSSFFLKKSLFIEMMDFVTPLIENKKLEAFDPDRKYRIQGGLLERYYAVWLSLHNLNDLSFKLDHFFAESTIQDSIFNKLVRRIQRLFSK